MTGPVVIGELQKNRRERLRIALDEWQGHRLVDLRITTQLAESADVWSPTKKGVSINVAHLPALVRALTVAEAKARELGLIGGDE
jgi:hypothetical protein